MQTLSRLPTTQPKTKKESVQNENGTSAHTFGSNISVTPKVLLQRGAHRSDRGGPSRPQLQRARALIEEHAGAVGRLASGLFRRPQQLRFHGAINHVKDKSRD